MLNISIPTACGENWASMEPRVEGRFCGACKKTVVDFTQMSDADVQQYLLINSASLLCGRFRKSQLKQVVLEIPSHITLRHLPAWKQCLMACLIVFSTTIFSCNVETKGELESVASAQTMTLPAETQEIVHENLKAAVQLPVDEISTSENVHEFIKGDIEIQEVSILTNTDSENEILIGLPKIVEEDSIPEVQMPLTDTVRCEKFS